jgi:hypothetical protein
LPRAGSNQIAAGTVTVSYQKPCNIFTPEVTTGNRIPVLASETAHRIAPAAAHPPSFIPQAEQGKYFDRSPDHEPGDAFSPGGCAIPGEGHPRAEGMSNQGKAHHQGRSHPDAAPVAAISP